VSRLRHDDRGIAMVTVIVLMGVILALGLATLSFLDDQQRDTGVTRQRETAFNLAEAALTAQIFALAQDWPGKAAAVDATRRYPTCNATSVTSKCPSGTVLNGLGTSIDAGAPATWETRVRDNGGTAGTFYNDSITAAQPAYDANGDGQVWVRAQATAKGRTRVLVSLVRVDRNLEDLPRAAVLAGQIENRNSGNKVLIEATAGAGAIPTAAVRCKVQKGEAQACLGHPVDKGNTKTEADLQRLLDKQYAPNITQQQYSGPPAMTAEARLRLMKTAQANGTYYTTCPSSPPQGQVVYIVSGACSWSGNDTVNSPTAPGIIILERASLVLLGRVEIYGVVYAANLNNAAGLSPPLIELGGNSLIHGGVLVDGAAGLAVGESSKNVTYDPYAFNAAQSYVSAGIVQNTWREIPLTGV
jgi:Tfp pilus assembly protein PilX